MSIDQQVKSELISKYKNSDLDTGSVSVQCAILTERINNLTNHLKTHKKDFICLRTLLILVSRRRKLLNYQDSKSPEKCSDLVSRLGIKYKKLNGN
jgi:small subunit ribosomal protein S15